MAARSETETPARRWMSRLPVVVFLASIALVAWRITRGVDLSDEAYYAIFLHAWFKERIADTPFLMLHQTSVLLVYPFAALYRAITGSTVGLMLFLRFLFLAGNVLAALAVVRFLRLAWGRPHRWLIGALLVAFVPYNLPAPSYNTMGLQAMLVASAAFGCAVLSTQARWTVWLAISAAAWTVAAIAYPPLVAPLGALCLGMLLVLRPSRRFQLTYLGMVGGAQLLGWGLVTAILGPHRIAASAEFQAKLSSTFDPQAIPLRLAEIAKTHPWFTAILAVALVAGLLRARVPAWICAIADALLVTSLLLLVPALFTLSHDALLVVALGGVALAGGLRRKAAPEAKLLALLYATSWVAGLAMAGTATLGPFKVPVGASLAACLAIYAAVRRLDDAGKPLLAALPALALLTVLTVSLFNAYYGELPLARRPARQRIASGAFAGLAAVPDDARTIEIAQQALRQHERPGDSLAVLGRFPGIYLLSNAPIRALVPYAFTPFAQPWALKATHDYYAAPENRPSLVLAYTDPHFTFINPFAPDFEAWYVLQASLPTPYGRLDVYRRKS